MVHNFDVKHDIVPNMMPKYCVEDDVWVVAKQHVLMGKTGKILKIFPNQKNVFYSVHINNDRIRSFPERMLERIGK